MDNKIPMIEIGPLKQKVSRIALGCMGLSGTWNPAEVTEANIKTAFRALETAVEEGINFYDHADIYGSTTCESIFGQFLEAHPGLREKLFLASKCGIIFADEQGPYRYNLSASYIRDSLARTLERLCTDYIDLYQIHRADPLTHPRVTAEALNQLVREGRVRYIGVSNYAPSQVLALQAYLDVPIISTQPAISLWNQETLDNGVLDQCMERSITPLAYSPLAGGLLTGKKEMSSEDAQYSRFQGLQQALLEMGEKYQATPAQIALAWLLQHPAGIIPLLGSNRPENIREGVAATRIALSREDWYVLWVAGRGAALP